MSIRTENLTILFVDIAGFTATTSRQSRAENAKLLQTFNNTLLPLIKSFKGHVVKSIGDALLLTFRSPTDAMLCAMSLQDAMHAHNLRANDEDKIHIRVAANLGEVRITKNDIFGEPVNVASRIEGVTPADEIYLSEAVYMAMNKAEVPAQEAGMFELAGVSGALRLYCIPRFAIPRLIPQQLQPQEQGSELLFPYGGMHQRAPETKRVAMPVTSLFSIVVAVLLFAGITSAAIYWWQHREMSTDPVVIVAEPREKIAASESTAATTVATQPPVIEPAKELPPIVAVDAERANKETKSTPPAVPPVATKPVVESRVAETKKNGVTESVKPQTVLAEKPIEKPIEKPAVTQRVVKVEPLPPAPTPTPVIAPTASEDFSLSSQWNVAKLKRAYRAGAITKPQYKQIAERLENELDAKVRDLKIAYRAKQISKEEYENAVRDAKREYAGR